VYIGDTKFDCKAIVNPGNVLAAMAGGKLQMVGLDSWDPHGDSNSRMDRAVEYDWLGHLLAPAKAAERLTFARHVVDDLNALMGPRKRRLGFLQKTRLNSDAPQRIVAGMDKMSKLLLRKLDATMKQQLPVFGAFSRRKVLQGY
jgi:hypothetical protein